MKIAPEKATLQKMIYFQEVVNNGSIRKAALVLHIPPSTLNYEIKTLEKLLGTALIATDKNKLTLTEDGKKFAAFTADVIQGFKNLDLGGVENKITEIVIASSYGICEVYIPKIMDVFMKDYPEIKIVVKSGPEFSSFTSHYCDVVIGPHLANRPDLSQTFLKEFHYYLYASKGYLEKKAMPKSLKDLPFHDCLVYDPTIASYSEKYNFREAKVESNSYRTLIEFAKLDHGIFPLSQEGLERLLDNKSDFVRLFDTPCETEANYFIYHKHSPKLMMIKKIKEIAEKLFNQGGNDE